MTANGEDWPSFFIDAIKSVDLDIELAMEASGSREGWLQTEVMMYGRRRPSSTVFIYPNYAPIEAGSTKKFDFAAYDSDAMGARLLAVAELKIMAGHYDSAWKCLTGGGEWPGFRGLPQGQRRPVTRDEARECQATWGLIPDAKRLW